MTVLINIQRIMDENNLTVHDIESEMSISRRTIYRTLRAEREPTLLELMEFARILKVPIEALYTIVETKDESDGNGKNSAKLAVG